MSVAPARWLGNPVMNLVCINPENITVGFYLELGKNRSCVVVSSDKDGNQNIVEGEINYVALSPAKSRISGTDNDGKPFVVDVDTSLHTMTYALGSESGSYPYYGVITYGDGRPQVVVPVPVYAQ